jgi:hypothetical protein
VKENSEIQNWAETAKHTKDFNKFNSIEEFEYYF